MKREVVALYVLKKGIATSGPAVISSTSTTAPLTSSSLTVPVARFLLHQKVMFVTELYKDRSAPQKLYSQLTGGTQNSYLTSNVRVVHCRFVGK